MSLFFKTREGQAPIDESIRKELKPSHIQDMSELYELESENIALGIAWTKSTNKDHLDYLTWLELHKHILCDIWKFAGTIRKVELQNPDFHKPYDILPSLKELENDLKTWIEFNHPPKEMMSRFHERLLTIHPFRDGNGRWSRVLTEFICDKQKFEIPTWGSKTIADEIARRDKYIVAVKAARHKDNNQELIEIMWE
jgi:fido (protein-threonine AMPylation protein)